VARPPVGEAKGDGCGAAEWYERLSGTRCQRKWSMVSTLLQDITVVVVGDVDERLFMRGEQV
jgi:hypothetical protein